MTERTCGVPACAVAGCPKGGKLVRGLCAAHYYRLRVHGDVQAHIPIKEIGQHSECTVAGCGRGDTLRRGLCTKHYQRWKSHGDPEWEPPRQPENCTIEGCGAQPTVGKGLCRKHFKRLHRTGSTADPVKVQRVLGPCAVDGCGKREDRRGLCTTHYARWKRHGDTSTVLRPWTPQDGLTCSETGCQAAASSQGLCRRHWVAAYHQKNREARNARMRAHYLANREEYYAKTNRRRQIVEANMDALDRALSADYRRAIAADACAYCGAASSHVDHVFPVAKGGTDHWWNLVRACEPCNKAKAAHCGTWFLLLRGGAGGAVQPAAVP
ncbi:HNH endonuclease [Streptomyces sp. PD-S100-1]|uniref:HNH endonuclease n=1 Tax=Streptomyces sp. PD-S100-1 TaxID=3394351 RepID=UPI0039BD1635